MWHFPYQNWKHTAKKCGKNQHLSRATSFFTNPNPNFFPRMNDTMPVAEGAAKRWCFTINNPTDDDKFWEDSEHEEQIEFLAVQYEVGEQGLHTTRAFSFSSAGTDSLGSRATSTAGHTGKRQEDQTCKHINTA